MPTTAKGHSGQSCDGVPKDKDADQDGWVFVLPGRSGTFISVTATFTDLTGGSRVYTTDANGGMVDSPSSNATSKAYILTPAGWTLTAASAEVSTDTVSKKFNLIHTCPGPASTPSPSPSTSESPSTSTPPTEEPSESGSPSESPSESSTPSESTSGTPSVSPEVPSESSTDGSLPITGASLTTAIGVGALLAAVGAVALLVMRRRRAAQTWE
ncbi:LPXTG-motif cell wall-anchored protein [Stackebrandtia endophytica]|uniref:LPXTG-motif cell wall-anchored protein n=1 Tax=Stackebrandtia endophytica TaxID=1496996 RepID=A0A543AX39_9ACTN|nr:LPXTG cell wall anchor domain-containing protein [Stackebrandtia endophytica]TQL77137.1 LPXTG-motif cell wall-anchored protein [Stackebrandtia endophytica]